MVLSQKNIDDKDLIKIFQLPDRREFQECIFFPKGRKVTKECICEKKSCYILEYHILEDFMVWDIHIFFLYILVIYNAHIDNS